MNTTVSQSYLSFLFFFSFILVLVAQSSSFIILLSFRLLSFSYLAITTLAAFSLYLPPFSPHPKTKTVLKKENLNGFDTFVFTRPFTTIPSLNSAIPVFLFPSPSFIIPLSFPRYSRSVSRPCKVNICLYLPIFFAESGALSLSLSLLNPLSFSIFYRIYCTFFYF